MSTGEDRRPAHDAINAFIRHLADRQLSVTTRRIRRHYLDEYLLHAQQAAGPAEITAAELMTPARAAAWLSDAADGRTRTRNTLSGPDAAAYSNSMRVRIDSYNAFAEFLGLPDRHDGEPPARGSYLTPADTERLVHDLAVRRPIHANAATSIRTAAVAALVADTGRTVPELARLNISTLHLEDAAHVELADGSCPLGTATVQILTRWLSARAGIIAELDGSDPGYLWIPTKPGRPRGGRKPVKPGLSRAAVRTLHAAHRTLVSQVLGTPLRPGALRAAAPSGAASTRPLLRGCLFHAVRAQCRFAACAQLGVARTRNRASVTTAPSMKPRKS
jgi:site-specific recombinase XerD